MAKINNIVCIWCHTMWFIVKKTHYFYILLSLTHTTTTLRPTEIKVSEVISKTGCGNDALCCPIILHYMLPVMSSRMT